MESQEGAAIDVAPFHTDVPDIDLEGQQVTDTTDNSSVTSSERSESQRRYDSKATSILDKANSDRATGKEPLDIDLRSVLLCIPGRHSEELESVCVTNSKSDKAMFEALNRCYYSRRKMALRWLTLRRLDKVNFAEVRVVDPEISRR